MAGRKIRDEEDARACLEAASRAGVSRRDWARAHGIDGRSLHCWYLSLRGPKGRLKPAEVVQLVELVPEAERGSHEPGFVVRSGGIEIEVGPEFDEGALLRLLRVVRAC